MSKFNLTMSIVIVATIVFFGFGIFQKANYKVANGDTVYISYSITKGKKTYDDQAATLVVGENSNDIFKDKQVKGMKAGSELNFDTKLTKPVTIDEETKLKKGTDVTIDGKITDVTPKATEAKSDATSEAASESK